MSSEGGQFDRVFVNRPSMKSSPESANAQKDQCGSRS